MAHRKHRKTRNIAPDGASRTRRDRTGPASVRSARPDQLWLYGTHAVHAALGNPRRKILQLLATVAASDDLPPSAVKPDIVNRPTIDAALPDGAVHQGLAAQVSPLEQPLLEEALETCVPGAPLLVLDQVTDPQNVGAILRSAAALGAGAVITTDRHAPQETGALAKAAAGALERMPMVRVPNLVRAIKQMADANFWILGLDAAGVRTLAEADPPTRTALVLGAEGPGLRRLTREACDEVVRLPIAPGVDSLNVSNAAAVALYELVRGHESID